MLGLSPMMTVGFHCCPQGGSEVWSLGSIISITIMIVSLTSPGNLSEMDVLRLPGTVQSKLGFSFERDNAGGSAGHHSGHGLVMDTAGGGCCCSLCSAGLAPMTVRTFLLPVAYDLFPFEAHALTPVPASSINVTAGGGYCTHMTNSRTLLKDQQELIWWHTHRLNACHLFSAYPPPILYPLLPE